MTISRIGVLGAGQMGSGIAQVCLMSGFQVVLADVSDAVLSKSRAGIGKACAECLSGRSVRLL